MATITTNTFLDDGTARTAGEAWTLNGGILTIRTDTRWHVSSPSSMLGSIAAITVSATLGGGVYIDATKVRWMAYDTGSGNVPSIGTNITQSGVTSSYLLGVYSSLTASPTSVGDLMPTSGFIKFREVEGAFVAGALSGIGAVSSSPDVTGWLEVVRDISTTATIPRLGSFITRGDWFYLGTTNGSADQTFQVPTNGGGSGTHVPGVWIETSQNSEVYEYYTSVLSAILVGANFGTDSRSKVIQSVGNGLIRIGNNGTTNVGFVPPNGCRVRIPNILCRQTSSTNRALNLVPHATIGSRPSFTTTSAGVIDMEYVLSDWYHLFASPYSAKHYHSGLYDIISISNIASALDIDDIGISAYLGSAISLTITTCVLGGEIKNSTFFRVTAASSAYSSSITTCDGITISNCKFGVMAYTRSSTGHSIYVNQSLNLTFVNNSSYNGHFVFNTSFNCNVNGHDHVDRFVGVTNTTTGIYAISVLASSDNIVVSGITFGENGTIANVYPYSGLFYSQNSSNITFKNAGTALAPLDSGTSNQSGYIYVDGGVNTNIRVQRCYLTATRTGLFSSLNTSKGLIIQDCVGTTGAIATAVLNALVKGVRLTSNSVTGQASCYGSHFFNMFISDTIGRIWFAFNEPTSFNTTSVTTTFGLNAGFTSGGQASMPNVDDSIVLETPYFIKGYTSFALGTNRSPVVTGTNPSNFKYEYDINVGSGYSGSYNNLFKTKTRSSGGTVGTNNVTVALTSSPMPEINDYVFTQALNQLAAGTIVTNVVGQVITFSNNVTSATLGQIYFAKQFIDTSISPSTGFKLKVKITSTDASTTNALTYLSLDASTTLSDQKNNTYPLETNNVKFDLTGLSDGTTVVLLNSSNIEVDRKTIVGATYSYNYEWNSDDGDKLNNKCLVWKNNKFPIKINNIPLGQTNLTIPVIQNDDLIYGTSSTNATIDFNNKLIIMGTDSTVYDIQGIYSLWKDNILLTSNMQYDFAYSILGGNSTAGSNSIPFYTYLTNGWKIRPDEASHTLNVTNGILLVDGGGDPFVDTLGTYTVRINYQQPVQAIAVSTTGGGGATPAEIWDYGTRTLSATGVNAIQSGLATQTSVDNIPIEVWDVSTTGLTSSNTTGKTLTDTLKTTRGNQALILSK